MSAGRIKVFVRSLHPLVAVWVAWGVVVGFMGCGKKPKVDSPSNQSLGTPIVNEGDPEPGQTLDAGKDLCSHISQTQDLKVEASGYASLLWSRTEGPGACVFSAPESNETKISCDTEGEHRLRVTVTLKDGQFLSDDLALKIFAGGGPGSIDLCTGRVSTALGMVDDAPMAVTVQPDGKIIVAGYSHNGKDRDFAAVRYQPDGTIDRDFGSEGKVITDISGMDIARDVKVQPDGKIVLAGDSTGGTGGFAFALARYDNKGRLDSGFNGTGKQGIAFPLGTAQAHAIALQDDGKIVIGGEAFNAQQQYDFGLARVMPTGELDTTFGTGGRAIADVALSQDGLLALTLQKDGKILGAGYGFANGFYHVAVARFEASGVLDTTFGNGGSTIIVNGVSHSGAHAIAVQSDGRIVIAGDYVNGASRDLVALRLNADGTLDTSFGNGGRVFAGFGATTESRQGLAIQSDGKIVIAGYGSGAAGSSAFVALRLNGDGTFDTSFDGDGRLVFDFDGANDVARAVALDRLGNILVTGSVGAPSIFGWIRIFH